MSIANIIRRDYMKSTDYRHEQELLIWYNGMSLAGVIHHGAMGYDPDGKCLSHYNKLDKVTCAQGKKKLMGLMPEARMCKDFEELHHLVTTVSRQAPGLGKLWAYDTAVAIGAKLGLIPEQVHLHQGALRGAQLLGLKGDSVVLEMFPFCWQKIGANGIESLLCWAHRVRPDDLRRLRTSPTMAVLQNCR